MDFHDKQLDSLTRELKTTTGMLDNLYLDKLKNRISDEQYDRFYGNLRAKLDETNSRLAGLQGAEENYYLTTRYILELAHRAYDLFVSSEVDERRQLINLVLQNVRIEGENVVWHVQKPFDLLIKNDAENDGGAHGAHFELSNGQNYSTSFVRCDPKHRWQTIQLNEISCFLLSYKTRNKKSEVLVTRLYKKLIINIFYDYFLGFV
jgi:hypothetical protein